jgi:uncharacterized repeat protein (TIGR01451 family)
MKSCGNPISAKSKQPRVQPVAAPKPSFTIQKDVRAMGQTAWSDTVRVEPGAGVEYRVLITNTSQADLQQAVLRDTLPDGITARGGFTANGKSFIESPVDNAVDTSLFLKQAQRLELIFPADVSADTDACEQGLVNTATVTAENLPEQSDTATVFVCQPEQPPAPPAPTPPAPVVQAAAPTQLVVTGPADILAIFLGVTLISTALYALKTYYLGKLVS